MVTFRVSYEDLNENNSFEKIKISELNDKLIKIKEDSKKYESVTIQEYPLKRNKVQKVVENGEYMGYKPKKRKHIVSFSGGKDSTAMLIEMLNRGMQVDEIVFADTKYELPEMYEYVNRVEEYIKNRFSDDLSIKRVRTDKKLKDLVLGIVTRGDNKDKVRGFPLTAFPCYWSRESKVKPLNKVMEGHYRYIGIAIDESDRQSKNKEDSLFIYPLIEWGWTEDDCMEYLEEIDLVNPLYNNNVTRTGCFWCPKQSNYALVNLYTNHPDKWGVMKSWEEETGLRIFMNKTIDEIEEDIVNKKIGY